MAPPKLYVDACCLIEAIKGEVGNSEAGRADEVDMLKRILKAARDEAIIAYTSLMTVAEVVKAGDAPIDEDIKSRIERLILSGRDGLAVVGLSPAIAIRARDLAWEDGLSGVRGADRLHLAAALNVGAREFLTMNGRLKKKVEKSEVAGMRLIPPSETKLLPGEYRANDLFEEEN